MTAYGESYGNVFSRLGLKNGRVHYVYKYCNK